MITGIKVKYKWYGYHQKFRETVTKIWARSLDCNQPLVGFNALNGRMKHPFLSAHP